MLRVETCHANKNEIFNTLGNVVLFKNRKYRWLRNTFFSATSDNDLETERKLVIVIETRFDVQLEKLFPETVFLAVDVRQWWSFFFPDDE